MIRTLGFLIVASAAYGATLTDDRIAEILKRLDALSARESPGPRADTRQRQVELLRNVQPASPTRPRTICAAPATLDESAKKLFMEDALAFIQTLRLDDQHAPLIELLDCAEDFHVTPELIGSVARQFLHVVEHTTEAPADYERLSVLRRRYEL